MHRKRGRYERTALGSVVPVHRAAEILIQRVQAVRLQFPKSPSQFLLDPVYRVEKCTPVDCQTPTAELPVRSQQKMKAEYIVFQSGERAAADQAEISQIFFDFPAIGHPVILAAAA
jgi:hypothetical protein